MEPLESTSTTATSTSATISSTTVFTPQACQRLGRVLSLSCDRFATWQATHVVLFFGGVALLASLAVVWPLTRDCRHRERRRRLRRLATATLARAAENLSLDNETGSKSHGTMNREDESSSLLVARKASDVLPYGTMDRME